MTAVTFDTELVTAALQSRLEFTSKPAVHLAYLTNTKNYYHVVLENVNALHTSLCRMWGACGGNGTPS